MAWGAIVGGASGVGSVWAMGGSNYSDGFWKGAAIGGTIEFLSSQNTINLVRGQGFHSNDYVLSRFISNEQYQEALDYFGIEGKYNPVKGKGGRYVEGENYYGKTLKNGDIEFGNSAFDSYGNLKLTSIKEEFHSLRAKSGIEFEKQFLDFDLKGDLKMFPEERLGFIHAYKNQGLVFNSTINIKSQISYYQSQCFKLAETNYYRFKWWHFIYKIPRRW
jgi:hypothetical protein